MNEKRKSFRNFIIFLLITRLFLISCSEDLYEETNGTHFGIKHKNNVEVLTGKKAVVVFNQLINESKKNKNFDILDNVLKINGKNTFLLKNNNQTTLDYTQIMQVVDNHGNTNYTFKILNHPDDDENTFHNLVFNNNNFSSRINILRYDNVSKDFRTTNNSTVTTTSLVVNTEPCDPIVNTIGSYGGNTGNPGNNSGSGGMGDNGGGGDSHSGSSGNYNNGNPFTNPVITVSFQCNTCSFSASTFESFSTHRDEDGILYGFTIIIKRTSFDSNSQTASNNPCDPQGSIGVLPGFINETPCESLKNLTNINKQNIKPVLDSLKTKVITAKNEWTTSHKMQFVYDPINDTNNLKYTNTSLKEGTSNNGNIIIGNLYISSTHTHPKGSVPIFSWADLKTLRDSYQECAHLFKGMVSMQIVCYNKANPSVPLIYSLKVNNFNALNTKINSDWDHINLIGLNDEKRIDAIHLNLEKLYDKNKNNLELFFLQNFKDYGIELYKANDELSNWTKLALDVSPQKPNGILIQIPCP